MTPVFADTYYFIALANPRDAGHRRAINFASTNRRPIVTTEWVLTELADGLAKTPNRHLAGLIIGDLEQSSKTLIVPATSDLFRRGVDLYIARPDKFWSLTDCISFLVMEEQAIIEAVTADQHFEQAGFVALLR